MARREVKTHGHPAIWAFLTILTFPIVLIATDLLEFDGVWPFVFALLATCAVLALEILVRKKLWFFEPHFAEKIGHDALPIRLIIFLGACLLVLQTAAIALVAFDRRADAPLLHLIAKKQCAAPNDPTASALCSYLTDPEEYVRNLPPKVTNLVADAMHRQAAAAWFPDQALVTCASRKMEQQVLNELSCRHVALVHCTSWGVTKQNILYPRSSQTRIAAAFLEKDESGFYSAKSWSDDLNAESWETTLGELASSARDHALSFAVLNDLITVLQAEALGKAQVLVGGK